MVGLQGCREPFPRLNVRVMEDVSSVGWDIEAFGKVSVARSDLTSSSPQLRQYLTS